MTTSVRRASTDLIAGCSSAGGAKGARGAALPKLPKTDVGFILWFRKTDVDFSIYCQSTCFGIPGAKTARRQYEDRGGRGKGGGAVLYVFLDMGRGMTWEEHGTTFKNR